MPDYRLQQLEDHITSGIQSACAWFVALCKKARNVVERDREHFSEQKTKHAKKRKK